jgi:hypothetical protein
MPIEVDNFFLGQPLNLGGGGSDPLKSLGPPGPSGCFGLPMMNLGRPPLPPNRPYRRPFNYHKYVKDSNPDAYVKVFKVVVKINGETKDAKIVNLFLPSKILCLIGVTITWEITYIVLLQNCN